MSPCMHVKRPFHVIVKQMTATETSGDCQPGNIDLLCGLSTHRTEMFSVMISCFCREFLRELYVKRKCILEPTPRLGTIFLG